MPAQIMTDRHKLASYVLYHEFGRTQGKIAELFDVSQPTVSNAIKEASYMVRMEAMQQELNSVRNELAAHNIQPPQLFSSDDVIDI